MKKIYTLAAAVLFAFSAYAAQPFSLKTAPKDLSFKSLSSKVELLKGENEYAKAATQDFAAASAETASAADPAAMYYEMSYSLASENGSARGWQSDGLNTVKKQDDGKYTMSGIWESDATLIDGVYDASANTLTFKGQVIETDVTENIKALRLVLLDIQSGSPVQVDGDIVFHYNAARRLMTYTAEDNGTSYTIVLGIAAYDASDKLLGYYDFLARVELNEVNGVNTFQYKDSEGNKKEGGVFVYNELVNGNLLTYGLLGSMYDNSVTFQLDTQNKTAKTVDAVISTEQHADGKTYEYKLYNFSEPNRFTTTLGDTNVNYTMTIETDEEDGSVYTEIMAPYVACGTTLSDGSWQGYTATGYFYDFTVTYLGDLTNTGVSKVTKDDDDNAPVEYYNLQGVKVANPENGIFIKKQGSKATKVVL